MPETAQASSAAMQADLARRAHVAELFKRATGQLIDDRLEVRLGAIYVRREVGNDFPDLSRPVFELLQAHLRGRQSSYEDAEPPIDIEPIIETLNARALQNA